MRKSAFRNVPKNSYAGMERVDALEFQEEMRKLKSHPTAISEESDAEVVKGTVENGTNETNGTNESTQAMEITESSPGSCPEISGLTISGEATDEDREPKTAEEGAVSAVGTEENPGSVSDKPKGKKDDDEGTPEKTPEGKKEEEESKPEKPKCSAKTAKRKEERKRAKLRQRQLAAKYGIPYNSPQFSRK